MTYTLAEVTYQVSQRLGQVVAGLATGGSTTTIIDTNLLANYPNDYFNTNGLGTAWVLYDAGGSAAAPEGEYSRVSDFVSATSTATLLNTLTADVAAGDRYAIANSQYPLDLLIEKVNEALHDIGFISFDDDTSLDTANNQTEYELPVANSRLKRVYIESITTDSNDNRWVEIEDWTIQREATGSKDNLILYSQYPSGYDLRIVYDSIHPDVYAYNSQISEQIPMPLLATKAALSCLYHQELQLGRGNDPRLDAQIRRMQDMLEQIQAEHKVHRDRRRRPLMTTAVSHRLNTDEPNVPS